MGKPHPSLATAAWDAAGVDAGTDASFARTCMVRTMTLWDRCEMHKEPKTTWHPVRGLRHGIPEGSHIWVRGHGPALR